MTRSSLKGVSNQALFAYKNGRFASRFLHLRIGFLEASKKANLPFKPDRVSFCTPKFKLLFNFGFDGGGICDEKMHSH